MACMNNDDFTVLVSGGGRFCWVRACVLCSLHIQNDWASRTINLHQILFKLEHSSMETIQLIKKVITGSHLVIGNWWLAASLRDVPAHASWVVQSVFGKTSNCPDDSAPLQPRFSALQLLASPQTKITFEREEISDQWDLGKYDGAADGDWENCVRLHGAYFEGDWGIIVLCAMFLASCIFFNKCLYFSYYMAGWIPSG